MAGSAQDQSSKSLLDIFSGDMPANSNGFSYMVKTNKVRNEMLRALVDAFREKKIEEPVIANLLLAIDENAEVGNIDEAFFVSLRDDPDFISKFLNLKDK